MVRNELAASHQPVKSAARTLELVEYLARSGGMHSLRDLHEIFGHPKSSLHALLRTLADAGWVEVDRTGTLYGLGLRALLVGMSYIDGDDAVVSAAGTLNWLAAESTETVHMARLDGRDVVYLATRDASHELRVISRIGHRLPAHATGLGKALLAERSDEELMELLPARLEALTPSTITDRSALLEDLAETRQRGYALDRQENTIGVRCMGIALHTTAGVPRDAVSLSVPIGRIEQGRERELTALLLRAKESIEREGWRTGTAARAAGEDGS
ncbi:MAG: IclR family transcriptional regulator [Actinomycetota bacterium]|nr:IclR family transcriptional regulator [Actinomycetota bacterium]